MQPGLGGVFGNSIGTWVAGFQKYIYTSNALQAEILAIQEGLKLAMDLNLFPLEIESDETKAVKLLTLEPNFSNPTALYCRSLMLREREMFIRHSSRHGNATAYLLDKEAMKLPILNKPYRLSGSPFFCNATTR
ncbi:PREDICTED: uncharacterized protein LOC109213230 [Nicotiana attenuata]|uniref:uncharacterized protein LOC109213230 n=1 Tax=Nicotiana attenuata TaxID=49451 RepID=UPI0009054C74|nr:PREDICTED: uncharacterized protein LOC109213230 [Nicotiana attenuata]